MNNGRTMLGTVRRETVKKLYGTPKGSAKIVSGRGTYSPVWEYRGVKFRGRRNPGWDAGSTWLTVEPLSIPQQDSKLKMMIQIDWHFDGKPQQPQ